MRLQLKSRYDHRSRPSQRFEMRNIWINQGQLAFRSAWFYHLKAFHFRERSQKKWLLSIGVGPPPPPPNGTFFHPSFSFGNEPYIYGFYTWSHSKISVLSPLMVVQNWRSEAAATADCHKQPCSEFGLIKWINKLKNNL